MRLIRALSVGLIAGVALLGCASGSSSMSEYSPSAGEQEQERRLLAQTEPIAHGSATLEVHGLSCPKCASNVDLTLARVKGVAKVDQVDMSTGEVRLTFTPDQHPSPRDLARAVDRSGYTLVAIRTP